MFYRVNDDEGTLSTDGLEGLPFDRLRANGDMDAQGKGWRFSRVAFFGSPMA